MAEKEIILQGEDGQVDELVLTTQDQASCNSLEDCVRMLFPQEGEKKPRLRFKGFEGEWKQYRLGDVGLFRSNGVDKKIYQGEAMINLLNYMDVYNFRKVTKSNCKDLMQVSASSRQIEECDIQAGDVFFTPTSETAEDIGHVMVIEEDLPNTCYSYHLMRYRPNKGVFYPTFPDYGFQTHFVREQMRIAAKGVQRFVLGKNDFESLLVYAPSLEEQEKIASFMRRLDDQMQYYKRQFEELKQLKSACMESMFPHQGDNVPSVRFKGFEGDWQKKELENCLEISEERNMDNHFGINDVLSVSDDFGVVNQIELLGRSYAGKSVSGYKVFRPGQIVYTKSPLKAKPYGIVKQNTGKVGIVSVLYAIYDTKEGVAPDYIHYYFDPAWRLNAYMRPLVNKGAKNTMNISDETALTGYIMIPKDIEEQRRIAAYLRSLDEQIAVQQQQLERLKQMKQSCLGLLFPDNQSITPPLRFKEFNGEWRRKMLGTIGVTYSGLSGKGKSDFGHGEALYITFLNVLNNAQIDSSMFEKVEIRENENQNRVLKGDLLFNTSSETPEEVAMCAVMGEEFDNLYLNSFCFGFRLVDTNVDPLFLAYQMRSPYGRKLMSFIAQGATRYNLPKREFVKTEICIPSDLAEQRRIATFFSSLDEQIKIQSQQVEKLKQVKKACLNQFIA